MTANPGLIRAESHEELGRLIQDHGNELIARWKARALEEQPTAVREHQQALGDHLPHLLAAIADRLRSGGNGATAAARYALQHGQQRWKSGWLLSEVVRDYQILRLVLLDFLEGALGRPLNAHEAIAVGLELDDAIIESVNAYVRHSEQAIRDEAQRSAERDRLIRDALEQGLVREAEALKLNDRRKNEFLALLGHELRNPLGAMANAMALTDVLSPTDADYQQVTGVIKRQLRQMERLVDDLLDITRVARGVLELRREQVDLADVLAQAAEAVRPAAEQRGQHFEIVLPGERLPMSADSTRLEQIFTNLLINAVKYTPVGGKIACRLERCDGQAKIRVIDTGIGIPPEMLPQIFELFMRAEHAARQAEGGLGLGLTLVRNLVQMHGGTIQAFSDGPDKGSEFVVELPLSAETADAQTKPPVERSTARAKVLVVDDNRDVALTLAALVRHSGHDVRTAHDGPTALALARDYLPELVLVDIGLPGMDGYEVARKLRGEAGLAGSMLAALTGYGQEEDRRRSEEAGFDQHLIKPIRTETLLNLLATASRRVMA